MSTLQSDELPAPAEVEPSSGRSGRARLVPLGIALLVIAIGLAHVLYANRGSWFYFDDWAFALDRGAITGDAMFGPQNQNWHFWTWATYYVIPKTFGLVSYLPFRVVSILILAAIAWLVYLYARRRVGEWWALLAVVPVLFTCGWEIVLWPFQIGQLLSLAGGIGALVLLDRPPTTRSRVGAALLLLVSMTASSAGPPMLIVVFVDRLLQAGRRRDLFTVVPGLVAYGWWYETWGVKNPNPNPTDIEGLQHTIEAVTGTAQKAMVGLFGFGQPGAHIGPILGDLSFLGLIVFICWRLFAPYAAARVRILALSAGLVGYWLLLTWGRAQMAGFESNPRYLYISALLITLLLVELGSSVRLQAQSRDGVFAGSFGRPLTVGIGVLVVLVSAFAAERNAKAMRDGGYGFRVQGWAGHGNIATIALVPPGRREAVPFYLGPAERALPLPAAQYLNGMKKHGDKLFTESDVRSWPEEAREWVDGDMLDFYGPLQAADQPRPKPAGIAPTIQQVGALAVTTIPARRGSCVKTSAAAPEASMSLAGVTAVTIWNRDTEPAALLGRRYAPKFAAASSFAMAPGAVRLLRPEKDLGTAPWTFGLRGRSFLVCTVA